MLYLIGQILFLLLLTAIMSGAMGWLLRSLGHERHSRQLESEWAAKLTGLRRDRDDYRDRLEQLQASGVDFIGENTATDLSDEQKAKIAAHVRKLEEEVHAGRERLASLTRKLEGVVDASAQREAEYNTMRERLEGAMESVRERDQKLEQFAAKATQAARQQTQNAKSSQRALEDRARELEQTIDVQKQRIRELENGAQAEKEQIEHGKLLNVIQAQKKTIASLNQRLRRTDGNGAQQPAGHNGDAALADILQEREDAIRAMQERLHAQQRQEEALRELEDENALLREALKGQDETIAGLEAQRQELSGRPDAAAQEELIERLQMRDETIAHLQTRLRELTEEARPGPDDESRYARMMEVIRAQEETIARLNERLRQPPVVAHARTVARAAAPASVDTLSGDLFEEKPATILDAPDGEPDNLKRIHGVGPILEAKLNELGVYHFRQIAAFGDEEIAWISTHMSSFPNRIIRDRWIDQAMELENERHEDGA